MVTDREQLQKYQKIFSNLTIFAGGSNLWNDPEGQAEVLRKRHERQHELIIKLQKENKKLRAEYAELERAARERLEKDYITKRCIYYAVSALYAEAGDAFGEAEKSLLEIDPKIDLAALTERGE